MTELLVAFNRQKKRNVNYDNSSPIRERKNIFKAGVILMVRIME